MSAAAIPFPLRPARVHEICGASAAGFAAIACAAEPGALLWLRLGRRDGFYAPDGIAGIFPPGKLLLAEPRSHIDMLAVAEEALKDGAIKLVVAEITEALDLREGRRLSLAAKAGQSTGLCLISEGMGSNVAETRWRCAPVFDPAAAEADSTLMHWEIIKNKSGTFGAWNVRWDATTHRLFVVPPAVL